ncbi:MAG: hypothetical protein GPJ54_02910 [Candidatus Heimdallarchaeota archaeon]|nr:hypothetical protein [Candidatus Heimdallarchaeota archaeon]
MLILLFLFVPMQSIAQESDLSYMTTGTIRENGDEYWDSNEYVKIKFEIDEGEIFQIELFTDIDAILYVMYGDFDDDKDIEKALGEVAEDGSSDKIIRSDSTIAGYATFRFTADKYYNDNIVIFTYNPFNPSSMSFTLYSSTPSGNRDLSRPTTVASSIFKYTLIFIFLLIIPKIILFSMDKTKFDNIQINTKIDLASFPEIVTHELEFIKVHKGQDGLTDSLPVFDKRQYAVYDHCHSCGLKNTIHVYSSKRILINRIVNRFFTIISFLIPFIFSISDYKSGDSIAVVIFGSLIIAAIGGIALFIIFRITSPYPIGNEIYGKFKALNNNQSDKIEIKRIIKKEIIQT